VEDEKIFILHNAEDVTEAHLRLAEHVADWFPDKIDWEEFVDNFADPEGWGDAGKFDIDSYDSPAIRKIKKHIREYRSHE